MYDTRDILNAARSIRPYLEALVGAEAPIVDAALVDLLARAEAGEDVDTAILELLAQREATRVWAQKFLEERRPPEAAKVFVPPEGMTNPAAVDRYICPQHDYAWHRSSLDRPVPECPTHRLPLELSNEFFLVPIFYGTDRKRARVDGAPSGFYGGDRGTQLEFGICNVSIPREHRLGALETPSILRLEFRNDVAEHVVLQSVVPLPAAEFFSSVKARIGQSTKKEAFVFVHGFNVSFEDAARRTAQIAYDLAFDGAPILYSWPSRGKLSLAGYRHDANNIRWTVPHLRQFLDDVAASSGAAAVHVIAHSMGNQALTEALKDISASMRLTARPAFTELVLTAPDIDADVFKQIAAQFQKAAARVTLYASANDTALRFSKRYQGNYARAGDTATGVLIVPGVDTIDVSAVDTNLIGHFYYGDNKSVLSDLFYLLKDRKPPDQRFGLVARKLADGRYWSFRP